MKPGLDVAEKADPVRAAVTAFVRDVALAIPAGARVLDAGAGEAVYRPLFAGRRYAAVDRAVGDPSWNYRALDAVADLEAVPAGDRAFDAVLCTETLEHVARPARVLGELARVLRPGGTIAISVPFLHPVHQAPHDYFRYTPFALRRLLGEAGFDAVDVRAAGGYFLHLYWQLQDLPSQLPLGLGPTWPLRAVVRLIGALLRGAAWMLRRRGSPEARPLLYLVTAKRAA